MASAALYLRTNSCNPAYTGVPYRGIGKYSDCLLLLFPQCCTLPHLPQLQLLMYGTGRLSAQRHNFWLSVPHGCLKFHTGHLSYSSSRYHDDFGHSSPLSQACFRQLDAVCQASSRTVPIQAVPERFFVVFVLLPPVLLMCAPGRRAYCNTAVQFLPGAAVPASLHPEDRYPRSLHQSSHPEVSVFYVWLPGLLQRTYVLHVQGSRPV